MADKRLRMPPELVQLTANWNILNGDVANNVLYMVHRSCVVLDPAPEPFTDAMADAQANRLATAFNTGLAGNFIHPSATLTSVSWVWNETLDTGPLHEGINHASPMPLTGGAGGDALPSGMSKAVRFQTGLGGRGNHGRMFLPALAENITTAANPDFIDPSVVATIQGFIAAFLNQLNNNDCIAGVGDQFNLVVASFISHGALKPVADYHLVTAANLHDTALDFQRRRAPLHARHH